MLGNIDHGDAWPVSVSSKEEEVGSKADCPPHSNTNLTEHDYMGLSTTSLLPSKQNTNVICSTGDDICDIRGKGLESGDTELRLGIGPVCNGDAHTASYAAHAIQSMPHQQLPPTTRQLIKPSDPRSDALHHPHGDVLVNAAMEVEQSFWPWIAPGRFRIPVPKVSTASAKRPYIEIGSENGENKAYTSDFSTESSTQPEAASHISMVSPSPQGGHNARIHNSSAAASWQSANSEAGIAYGNSYTLANRSLPPPQAFKLPPTPSPSNYSPQPPSTPASAVPLHSSSLSDGRVPLSCLTGQEDVRMSKAPVVGWPPVRSFRKNTLHSTAVPGANKASNASSDVSKHEDAKSNPPEARGEQNRVSNKDTLFVKAKLDGVRICRKVDLTSYNDYESLKSALQEMFQGFICSDSAKLDLVQGNNYVLTHEDKDGDWMLVGDVPWHMFVTTVKSLRIMRAVDAVGLGEKVVAKLRTQDIA